ncbi:MAG: hypothetical protein L3J66_01960 [Bacteroidales bacterium]|nr:hypothetical protein [Bacteroidales bacterium]
MEYLFSRNDSLPTDTLFVDTFTDTNRAEINSQDAFPVLVSTNNYGYYREKYNLNGVPSIIILNKNSEMIYNSSLNTNPMVWVNNLQRLVDKELQ